MIIYIIYAWRSLSVSVIVLLFQSWHFPSFTLFCQWADTEYSFLKIFFLLLVNYIAFYVAMSFNWIDQEGCFQNMWICVVINAHKSDPQLLVCWHVRFCLCKIISNGFELTLRFGGVPSPSVVWNLKCCPSYDAVLSGCAFEEVNLRKYFMKNAICLLCVHLQYLVPLGEIIRICLSFRFNKAALEIHVLVHIERNLKVSWKSCPM